MLARWENYSSNQHQDCLLSRRVLLCKLWKTRGDPEQTRAWVTALHLGVAWEQVMQIGCYLNVSLMFTPPFLPLSLTLKKKKRAGFTYPTTALNLKVRLTLNFSSSYLHLTSSGVAMSCVQGAGDRVSILHEINWAPFTMKYIEPTDGCRVGLTTEWDLEYVPGLRLWVIRLGFTYVCACERAPRFQMKDTFWFF